MPVDGVSVVIPVRNGERWLTDAIDAIAGQRGDRPFEVIVVDDGSEDGSRGAVDRAACRGVVQVIDGPRRGAAAAINAGFRRARYPFIAQIDQDVVVGPGWLDALLAALADHRIGAAQGYYETDRSAPLTARVMGRDLEQRYDAIESGDTDHVCTGNVVYRADALRAAGPFDESLGYGYDNDMSYRLVEAGHRLVLCRLAKSRHCWRSGIVPYLVQQYGFGYGRIDVVARHQRRVGGDRVSPTSMMLHPIVMLIAAVVAAGGVLNGWRSGLLLAGLLVSALLVERAIAGWRAARAFRDPAGLAFPLFHLMRDAAWASAIVVWCVRWAIAMPTQPAFSMRPRPSPRRTADAVSRIESD